ncbi:MAG: hypothetical protein HY619_04180, partial [Thaumarchaeota archaeon]|nr:hypothetical protein [Nitrososphaerota archaeon]
MSGKTRSRRARRRGISTALGTLIFLLVAIGIIASIAFIMSEQSSYNLAVRKSSELVTMKGKEHLKAYSISGSTILINNDGSITSKIIGLLDADDRSGRLSLGRLSIMVSPGQRLEYSYQILNGKKTGILTNLGNIFWVDPNAPPDSSIADFALSVIPTLITIEQGGSSSTSVSVISINGYNKPVGLSVSGIPQGVTYNLQPQSGAPTFQSALTLSVSTSTPVGAYTVTVTGDDGQGKIHSTSFTLQVNAPSNPDFTLNVSPKTVALQQGSTGSVSVSLQPLNGYSKTVTLSASGFPSGISYSFNPLSAIPPFSSILSISVGSTAQTGTYTIEIIGSDGSLIHQDSFALQISAQPDFTIAVAPGSFTLERGTSRTASVTIGSLNGYSNTVTLSLNGLPSGASYSFNPSSGTPSFTSTLTINAGTANAGTYTLTITGMGS